MTEKNIKNVSFTKVLKEQEEEVISIMADLFDLSNIDWNDIESRSHNSIFKEVCDYINKYYS